MRTDCIAAVPADRDLQHGGPPPERFVRQAADHGAPWHHPPAATPPEPLISGTHPACQHRALSLKALPGDHQPQVIQPAERGDIRGREGSSVRDVEVFLLACVRTPIIERPRPQTPPRRAPSIYTLIYEERWPTSTGHAPATDPPKPSTDASNTYEAQPSASATSPTTSPDACSKPEDSDPNYTLLCEEPVKPLWRRVSPGRPAGSSSSRPRSLELTQAVGEAAVEIRVWKKSAEAGLGPSRGPRGDPRASGHVDIREVLPTASTWPSARGGAGRPGLAALGEASEGAVASPCPGRHVTWRSSMPWVYLAWGSS